jgi:AraC-like DNA-binding protein
MRYTETLTDLETLYLPQVEQFGIELAPCGEALVGQVDSDAARASMCVYRLGKDCVVEAHRILVRRDLPLYERGVDSLCISSLSADSLALCPVAPVEKVVGAPRCLAVFGQRSGETTTWLRAGSRHDSSSVVFLPSRLNRLDAHERRAARALVEEPGLVCADGCASSVGSSIDAVMLLFGGRLARGRTLDAQVDRALLGVLAWREECERAERAAGTHERALVVRGVKNYVTLHLSEPLTLDVLAHDLLTSRTRLCATFQCATGQSVGSFVRSARIARSKELLAVRSLGVAEVAHAVGYPRTSSFTVAFEREEGLSPSAWRAARP